MHQFLTSVDIAVTYKAKHVLSMERKNTSRR